MPTLLSCFCAISKVSCRSWLPLVVVKRKDSFPTPGHDQIRLFEADGAFGPPVQPAFLRMSIAFFWLNDQRFQFVW